MEISLLPIGEDDIYFNEKMIKRIQKSAKQARNGEYIEISSGKEIKALLGL